MVGGLEGWGTRRRDRMRGCERDKRVSRRCRRSQQPVTPSQLTLDGLAGAKGAAGLTEFDDSESDRRKKIVRVGHLGSTLSRPLSLCVLLASLIGYANTRTHAAADEILSPVAETRSLHRLSVSE
jgi:hypothetical protein